MNEDLNISFQGSVSIVWNSVLSIWQDLLEHLPFLISGLVLLVLTHLASKAVQLILSRFLRRTSLKRGLKDLLRQLSTLSVWVLGLTLAAVVIFPGMTPTKVLAGLGLGSVALGFAFKDIVENFLAGILILWRFPFDPGDFIRWGDIEGQVEEVTIRMTLIRQTNGELVSLPNAKLFKEPVHVLTNQPLRRVTIICGVAYGESISESRAVISRAVQDCETVSAEKPVEIFAQEFADSSINFEVTWWCSPTPLELRQSKDEVVSAVKDALDANGIEIPFPYRTLTFKKPLDTVVLRDSQSQRGASNGS